MGIRQALIGLAASACAPFLALSLLVAAPALMLVSSAAQAQGAIIREIRVEGNRRIEPETVRSYMKLSVGEAYDEAKADESLRALFATGLFSDVKINRTSNGILVVIAENPVIGQVAFEGNSEVEKSTLEAEVQLKPRSVFTRAKAQADVQRILAVYQRQGRFAASVQPKLIETDNNRVNVVFEINEGKATKVKSIAFVGNHAFSDSQLRDIITTIQSGLFDFLKGTNIYDPDRLNLDKELLRQYYLKNGYADARVISANAELDRDGSGFFITFVIEEGALFNFGAVTVESKLPGVNTSALSGEITTKQGAVFNAQLLDKTTEALTLKVAEQGFAFGRVRPRTDRVPGTNTINVIYVVEEGPRIYIERINVLGNERTKDYVIRREFRLAEGDAYNQLLIENAKKRLQNLGFFKSVEIKRRNGSAPDRIIIDVELVEQPTGELSFGAGYSTSEGVIGDISIAERNLLGNGQYLKLGLSGSKERLGVILSFTEPRFLGSNVAAGFDIFRNQTTANSTTPYNTTKTGAALRAAFPLAENMYLNTAYTVSRDTINIPTGYAYGASAALKDACGFQNNFVQVTDVNGVPPGPSPPYIPTYQNQGSCDGVARWTSMASLGLTIDNRNHPKTPTSGTFFQTGVDVAGLGGDVHYARFSAEGRAYYPIAEKVTFVARAAGGTIMGWGGQDVRLLDLFYKGGETVRGFNNLGYGPRDLATGNALGGHHYWTTTAELRFPLPLVPDDLGMTGAVFADAGSLFGAGNAAKALNGMCGTTNPDGSPAGVCLADDARVRSSVGASILWNSPLGPLRLDVAKALTHTDYDKLQIFRFGATTKF